MEKVRLQKFMADAGLMSRRAAEQEIKNGKVTVNGIVAEIGIRVDPDTDVICYLGKRIKPRSTQNVYLMLNKPQGYLSATEDDRDPVVTDLVPEEFRHFAVFPVGRLDKDTEGLLLLTNDGQFDHELMSPRKNLFKRYYAELDMPATQDDVKAFAAGMVFKDFTARPARLEIDPDDTRKVFVEISEGKYHQVKRMCEQVGKTVLYLKRVGIGSLQLDNTLECGKVRELTAEELALFGYAPGTLFSQPRR